MFIKLNRFGMSRIKLTLLTKHHCYLAIFTEIINNYQQRGISLQEAHDSFFNEMIEHANHVALYKNNRQIGKITTITDFKSVLRAGKGSLLKSWLHYKGNQLLGEDKTLSYFGQSYLDL